VLAVRDNELDVGDSEVASSEVAEGRACAGRREEVTWMTRWSNPASRLRVSGKNWGAHANNLRNHVFNGYIRILLIKTISTMYICCKKHGGKGVVCVLAVRDDELNVGGIEDASSGLAEGRDTRGKALGSKQNTWEHVGTGP
jgi:hypothetical protein